MLGHVSGQTLLKSTSLNRPHPFGPVCVQLFVIPGIPGDPRCHAGWASASVSGRMSMRHPVSRAARRAFCPSLPIASDSW